MKLYFIAIIPPEAAEQGIHAIKQEISEKYDTKKALKLPAHITLEPPFKMKEEKEAKMLELLKNFAAEQKKFKVKLKDFAAFAPKTIFLKVENPEPMKTIFHSLQQELKVHKFIKAEKESIHPHVTVAFRDLDRKNFRKAWQEFKERKYEESFLAEAVFLLKHNGETWDIFKKFNFEDSEIY